MISPPFLKKGDTIAILASASAVKMQEMDWSKSYIEQLGFRVELGRYLQSNGSYFAGTDQQRLEELQAALDNPNIHAIFFARGGYGSVRIIDQLSFKAFKKHPKWLIGFSDITLFHLHLATQIKCKSIHGPMPNHFSSTPKKILTHLFTQLQGKTVVPLKIKAHPSNILGTAKGRLIGGNLSLLVSALGSTSMPNFKGKILVLEDVGEYRYAIDRMLYSLHRAGVFKQISGLIIGAFTDTKDTNPPFGQALEELVLHLVQDLNIPVVFHFPCGHIPGNFPIVMGAKAQLQVDEKGGLLTL